VQRISAQFGFSDWSCQASPVDVVLRTSENWQLVDVAQNYS